MYDITGGVFSPRAQMVDLMEVIITKAHDHGNDLMPDYFQYLLKSTQGEDLDKEAAFFALSHLSEKVEDGGFVSTMEEYLATNCLPGFNQTTKGWLLARMCEMYGQYANVLTQ